MISARNPPADPDHYEFHENRRISRGYDTAESTAKKLETRATIQRETPIYLSPEPCPCPPNHPRRVAGVGVITVLPPQATPLRLSIGTHVDGDGIIEPGQSSLAVDGQGKRDRLISPTSTEE